jgi:curved DNA-binding protein CbpA
MAQRTLYELLMLHPSAIPEVISAVYRALAKQYHPDHAASGNQARMAEINEAHAILIDPDKRARYDASLDTTGMPMPVATARYAATASATMPRASAPGAQNLKYDSGNWSVRSPSESQPAQSHYGEAGEPPPYPPAHGSVLSFGRYKGWAISQVASGDRDYLEWLARTMAGRTYAAELESYLK